MARQLAVLGVPSSAGAHAGQDLTPAALRALGLVERLAAAGVHVRDVGDVAGSVWAPDRPDAGARNLDAVTRVATGVADAVERERAAGRVVLQSDGTFHEAKLLSTAGPVFEINGQIHLGYSGRMGQRGQHQSGGRGRGA